MKRKDSPDYKAWFKKGSHDLEDARRLLDGDGYTDTICFLCQQAVEKYLKGYLVAKNINPRPLHQLEELAKDCVRFEKRFLDFLDEYRVMTRYYIETRYPPLVPIEYTKEEAEKAVRTAEEIIKFVKNKFNK